MMHRPSLRILRWFSVAACSAACVALPNGTARADVVSGPCSRPVLTLDEAAGILRVDASDLATLAGSGDLPARRIGESWRFSCTALMGWLAGEPVATRGAATAQAVLDPEAMATVIAAGTANQAPDNADPDDPADESIGEAPENPTAEDVFLRSQRVLLAPGDMTFDFGAFYSQRNGRVLTIADDTIALATLEQETVFSALQMRLGIARETELFAGASYASRESNFFLGDDKLASSSESDLGNIRLGLRRTLLREGPGRPSMVVSVDGYIPTGDTSYAAGLGLSFVKSIDPVALFASLSYRHTFNEEFDDITQLEPEQRLDAVFGYALALNDTLSLNTSITASFAAATEFPEFPGVELRQQDSYAVQFGLTSWLARGLYIEPVLSYQLDGPDDGFALGITLFRFPP